MTATAFADRFGTYTAEEARFLSSAPSPDAIECARERVMHDSALTAEYTVKDMFVTGNRVSVTMIDVLDGDPEFGEFRNKDLRKSQSRIESVFQSALDADKVVSEHVHNQLLVYVTISEKIEGESLSAEDIYDQAKDLIDYYLHCADVLASGDTSTHALILNVLRK